MDSNSVCAAIVDYGSGNFASIQNCLKSIGVRSKITCDKDELSKASILILPGVGAFPTAMAQVHLKGLASFLQQAASSNKPLIGICLGMQLLTEASNEFGYTNGLSIIPGTIESLQTQQSHIGWNSLECLQNDRLLGPCDGDTFYYNHSFSYSGPQEYIVGVSSTDQVIPAIIRRGNSIGLQFHPEKSQAAGKRLMRRIIYGLLDA